MRRPPRKKLATMMPTRSPSLHSERLFLESICRGERGELPELLDLRWSKVRKGEFVLEEGQSFTGPQEQPRGIDASELECVVCYAPLSAPIFQCMIGHAVCKVCRDKSEASEAGWIGKCDECGVVTCHCGGAHMFGQCDECGVATPGYARCDVLERIVDLIHVRCPYSANGCDATPLYHDLESHCQVCPHAPRRCPGKSCAFIGPTAALLDHFARVHKWPKVRAGETFSVRLCDGFNFFLLDNHDRGDGDQAGTASILPVPCLLMLNVMRGQPCSTISVLCIHPRACAAVGNGAQPLLSCEVVFPPNCIPHASAAVDAANGAQQLLSCELVFSPNGDGSLCQSHKQSSVFKVVSTDLAHGLPGLEGCFQFFVSTDVLEGGDNSIEVNARIIN